MGDEHLHWGEWTGTLRQPRVEDEPPERTEPGVIAHDAVDTTGPRREVLERHALDALDRLLGEG